MIYQKLSDESFDQVITLTVETIKRGGIVCLPFDTVYGLICNPKNEEAVEKIFRLKERDASKSIGLTVDSAASLGNIAESKFNGFIEEKTPGSYTFILGAKDKTFSKYCYKNSTIGVRIPDSKLILEICRKYGEAIAQTSANKSGRPNVLSVEKLKSQFKPDELDKIDLIIDGGTIGSNGASEIYDLTGIEPRKIERS